MADKTRWGILGTGNIARKFAAGLAALDEAQLVAVGSRSQEKAQTFAREFGAARALGSYAELASDPGVDVIYIATPHSLHRENSLLCLRAGKPVLCEKPLAVNACQEREMIDCAREHGLFLMEAMWTRFLPTLVKARELLRAGAIGEVRMLQSDFGFCADFNPEKRLFNPELGGGSLLDVGVYPVALASMVFGRQPEAIHSAAALGETGVDERMAAVFTYPGGGIAQVASAVRTQTRHQALIFGTEGSIELHPPFWQGTELTLKAGERDESMHLPYAGNGYNCEAAEVGRCLREGRSESVVMPLDESLAIMRTMDAMRAQWGLKYPME